jgi:S1-C subfamily serine protease
VDAVVDGGLGRFLGFVRVEARLDGDAFVGWQIQSLAPAETWADVDLLPGDVVTRINGGPIEREGQAFAAFSSLKRSDRLVVTFLRGEQQHELAWRIVNRPGLGRTLPSPSATPSPSVAPARSGPAPSAPPASNLPPKK